VERIAACTGEILFHNWGVEGSGANATYSANIEYTFPLEFAELVWSNGTKVDRKIINLTDTTPFGTKNFKIPFDATDETWVRFAVWDSAGNGAWVQPAAVRPSRVTKSERPRPGTDESEGRGRPA
jgi:hypothetical protein